MTVFYRLCFIITTSQFISILVKTINILTYYSREFQNVVYHFCTIKIEEDIEDTKKAHHI